MSVFGRRSRPAARAVRRAATLAVITAIGSVALAGTSFAGTPPTKGASANDGGGNGTVKVDGAAFDDKINNEPHVGCTFHVDFFGFDKGTNTATVTFRGWSPSVPKSTIKPTLGDSTFTFTGNGPGHTRDATQSYQLDTTTLKLQPNQGYHVKITTLVVNAAGQQTWSKSKVIWVQPCPSVTKTGPATGTAGGRGVYTVTVTNGGDVAATDVTFVDALPVGETFVSADPAICSASGSPETVTCALTGALAVGASQPVEITVAFGSDTGGQALTDCAGLTAATAISCVDTTIESPDIPDLRIAKAGPDTGTVGDVGTYTLTVSDGVGAATVPGAITVTDSLPAGETFVSAAGDGWSSADTAQVVTFTHAGPLSAGSSLPPISVTVRYAATGRLTDVGLVAPAAGEKHTSDNQSSKTTVVSQLSLSVTKSNDANADGTFTKTETAPAPARAVTFRVVVENTSALPVVIDAVSDAVPVGSTPAAVACLTAAADDVVGSVLAPGGSVSCSFAGTAPSTVASSVTDEVVVRAHQAGDAGNTVSGADTSTVRTPPAVAPASGGAPDLAIVKAASVSRVTPGDTLAYRLLVRNVGPGATTGAVTVTDALPAGLRLGAVNGGSTWTCHTSGRTVTCVYAAGSIAAGERVAAVTIATTVLSSAPSRLDNTGVVSTSGDNNAENNTSTVKTPVTRVLGERIPRGPSAPSTPSTPSPSAPSVPSALPAVLPFTGTTAIGLLPDALGMVTAGLLLVVGARRRVRFDRPSG